jgi:hypothetical protein
MPLPAQSFGSNSAAAREADWFATAAFARAQWLGRTGGTGATGRRGLQIIAQATDGVYFPFNSASQGEQESARLLMFRLLQLGRIR